MSTTVPGGLYRGTDGTYHNAKGEVIPEKEALEMLAKLHPASTPKGKGKGKAVAEESSAPEE